MAQSRRTIRSPLADRKPGLASKQATKSKVAKAHADLKSKNAKLTRELNEALDRQTATSDVLKAISRSTFDLQSVLETLTETAARLCSADMASIARQDEGGFYQATNYNFPADWVEYSKAFRTFAGRGSVSGRALLEGRAVQVADVEADAEYTYREQQKKSGYRTFLAVPLLRNGQATVLLNLGRKTVKPFTEKQIELVSTFADQAVIAIENVRLFDEVQARTRDLTESLEQQTATSEVLKVISSSPGELDPVFQTMLSSATRICEAKFGMMYRFDNGQFHPTALLNVPPALAEFVRDRGSFLPPPGTPLDRLFRTKEVTYTVDETAESNPGAPARLGGARSLVGVPMLKENELVGAIIIYRQEVRPFTDKQVELVTSFASQAVIAIENTRLLKELRQRTADLSRSLDELRAAQDRLVQTEKLASLGQLTAGIAHEIKNPLNFVNNFSALSVELIGELNDALKPVAMGGKLREEVNELAGLLKDNLEKVVQHGKRADSIVKNMLLHSREGSGERRPSDINALLDESLNLAYHGARAEKPGFHITLDRDFDPVAGMVDVYPQEITRVLLNLISNGFYAATRRAAEIGDGFEPALRAATKNRGDKVEIRIRDNGMGIAPEVKEKIFNPFFTTKPAGEGTGLGLSMSHDIVVKQHGGKIDVDTEPGDFTEFIITLPRTVDSDRTAGGTT
jgi:two-component system, NtrC family, sensor kinase